MLKALKELDFTEFVEEVTSAWDQFKEESKGESCCRAWLWELKVDLPGW